MTKFTRDAVSEALHAAVAEKGGDYVYADEYGGCTYSKPGDFGPSPACIVGHVVAKLDPELFRNWAEYEIEEGDSFMVGEGEIDYPYDYEQLENEDGYWVGEGEPRRVRKAFNVEGVTTLSALSAAQTIQDAGRPWKMSQEAFDRVLAGEDREAVENEILLRK